MNASESFLDRLHGFLDQTLATTNELLADSVRRVLNDCEIESENRARSSNQVRMSILLISNPTAILVGASRLSIKFGTC